MGKSRWLVTYEVPVVIPLWRLWWWCLIQLGLHIGHCASHVGQQLRLCGEELLHPYLWQWWWHLCCGCSGCSCCWDGGYSYCLFFDAVLEADQLLIRIWCSPSDRLDK